MKKRNFLIWPAVALGVGGISYLLSRKGMEQTYPLLEKSVLTPPDWLFPIVWSILYILMGVGFALVLAKQRPGIQDAEPIWILQLGANFLWSLLFFRWGMYGTALVCLIALWLLIVIMIVVFGRTSRLAAWLQVPYLLRVSFAGYLNYVVWQLNP